MIQIQILAGEYWKGVYSRKSKKNMLWVTMNATGDIPHSVLSNGAERSIKCRFLVYRWSYPWFSLALGSSWGPASYFYYFSLFPPFISLFNFFLRLYNHGVVPFCAAERVLSEVRASKIYLFKRWCWALLLRERLLQFVSSRWRFIAFRDNLLKNPPYKALGVQLNWTLVHDRNNLWSQLMEQAIWWNSNHHRGSDFQH